jgi:hypothetical protein
VSVEAPPAPQTPDVRPRTTRWLPVLPVALLSFAMLWWPAFADQELFAATARQMSRGAVYYRDYWDIKQPGIYWFYQFGDLLGRGSLGAHLLECLLIVAAAGLVTVTTADWDLRRSLRCAAPTMVLGPYLVWSYNQGVGQVEGLMNILLITVLAATWPGAGARLRPTWAWFIAGLAVGAVVLLKTIYGPLPMIPLNVAAVLSLRIDRRAGVRRIAAAALGALVPVLAALAYFVDHGVLELALRTTFELPSQVAAMPDTHNASSRAELPRALKNMFSVIGPLAAVGLFTARRRGQLTIALTLATTTGAAMMLSLPQLWTTYRWLMLAAPLGLLAVLGLETVLTWLQEYSDRPGTASARRVLGLRLVIALVAVALTVPMFRAPAKLVLAAADRPWGLDDVSRIGRNEPGPPTTPERIAATVADLVSPGDQIYVMGDPAVMTLLHATQGAQIAGWSMPMMPPIVWDELARELNRARPRLIFVDSRKAWDTVRDGDAAAVFGLLEKQYRVLSSTADGTWYETDDPGSPLPEPGGNRMFAEASTE